MAEIEQHFEIDNFKFVLILKSRSIEAHSLITDNKEYLQSGLKTEVFNFKLNSRFQDLIEDWKEKHK